MIKWLTAAYALALGVLLVTGARFGDRYGQRRKFLGGMIGFTAASAACGLAGGPALLIVARALQGAFGALLIPQDMAILQPRANADGLRALRPRCWASPRAAAPSSPAS